MWKKEETQSPAPAPRPETTYPQPEPYVVPTPSTGRATIGRSITIKGEVTGDEDLFIQGRVDGSVDLKQHSVTVGAEGQVKANIIGRVVTVEGRVPGNLNGDEQVVLRSSAWVEGDIAAPRVILEDGTHFRGSVDMGEKAGRETRRLEVPRPEVTKEPEAAKPAAAEAISAKIGKAAGDGFVAARR